MGKILYIASVALVVACVAAFMQLAISERLREPGALEIARGAAP